MKRAIALILVFLLLDIPESLAPVLSLLSPAEAEAANWMCGQDLDGNGYVGDPGETAKCIATPQGELCPIGAANCSTIQTCPLGNYPCSGGSCTQAGVCSAVQVPYTDYQCPTDGKTYSDPSACNSNCIQTAICNYNSVPQYTCSYNGATYSDSATCSNNCYQAAYCSGSYNPVSASGNVPDWGGSMFGTQYYQVTGSGNTLYFYTGQMNFLFGVQWTSSGSISLSGGVTFSGSLSWDAGHCSSPRPGLISASGNSLYFYGYCGGWVYLGSIAVYGATPSGSASYSSWPYSLGSMSSSGAGINFYYSNNYTGYIGTISFSGNILSYSCPLGGYSCVGSPPYCTAYYGCNNTSYSYYSCPISGGSSCSGSPPSCSKGQTCVTRNGTTTKYQCSLTGVNYYTQNLCTSACFRTASCNTNYQCTYDNTVFSTAADCQNNCNFFQCPADNALYLSTAECQNGCASFICQNDGAKYPSYYACASSCKEARSCTPQ